MKIQLLRLIAALLLGSGGVALADTVDFNPGTSDVKVGDTIFVDIVGDFTEPGLAGGNIDLGFNNEILTIDSVEVNSTLFAFDPDGGGPAIGNVWPDIFFDVDTIINEDPPATGTFTIATITLTAIAEGTSSLMILGGSNFFSTTAALSPTLFDGTVNVSAVPIPAAVWLFGSGLLGLVGLARRKTS